MTDLTSATLRALAAHSSLMPALAFASGVVSSVGPCVAPRMIVVASLSANKPARYALFVVAVFAAGVVAAYSALALGGSLLWHILGYSRYLFIGIAGIMAVVGVLSLARHSECRPVPLLHGKETLSSVFLLGAASAATFSPCCMPVIAAAVLYAHSAGLLFVWLMAACFALGHAAPLVLAVLGTKAVEFTVHSGVRSAARVVASALMLAVAGFYFVLA